jgi:hypothetical protein
MFHDGFLLESVGFLYLYIQDIIVHNVVPVNSSIIVKTNHIRFLNSSMTVPQTCADPRGAWTFYGARSRRRGGHACILNGLITTKERNPRVL